MTTKYTDAPRTRVMTPASLNNGVHENHSIGQTMAIAPKKGLFDDISIPQIIAGATLSLPAPKPSKVRTPTSTTPPAPISPLSLMPRST